MNPRIITEKEYQDVIKVGREGIADSDYPLAHIETLAGRMQNDERIQGVLIPEICLRKRTVRLAEEIGRTCVPGSVLDMIVVLTGSFIFAADLGRELYVHAGVNIRFHMIKTSVYDKTIKQSGEKYRAVKLDYEPREIEGKNVLVVEDITDQGFTLAWLKNYLLSERNVKSMKICSLLQKVLEGPSDEVKKIRDGLSMDHTGFIIPDVWVAGYGIDACHELRNVPCVITIKERRGP